jgi:hypothetical protein
MNCDGDLKAFYSKIDGEDVRILKVKEPWASALVLGIKDVENRSWKLKVQKFPAWVIIASSKSKPTGKLLSEYKLRLEASRFSNKDVKCDRNDDEFGNMIGIVKIKECRAPTDDPVQSVWYTPPNYAWVVERAWSFENPIPLEDDDKMQTQARLAIRPQYQSKVREEIRNLLCKIQN